MFFFQSEESRQTNSGRSAWECFNFKLQGWAVSSRCSSLIQGTQMWILLGYEWTFVQASQWAFVYWWEKAYLSPLDSWMAPRPRDGPISLLSFVILTGFPLLNCTLEGNKESTCSSTFNIAMFTDTRRRESDACCHLIPIPVQSSTVRPGSAVALSWCQAVNTVWWAQGLAFRTALSVLCHFEDFFSLLKKKNIHCGYSKGKMEKKGIKTTMAHSMGVQWFLRKQRLWNEQDGNGDKDESLVEMREDVCGAAWHWNYTQCFLLLLLKEMGKDWRSAVVEKWAEQQGSLICLLLYSFYFFHLLLIQRFS